MPTPIDDSDRPNLDTSQGIVWGLSLWHYLNRGLQFELSVCVCAHVTTHRDFTNLQILTDLYKSLEFSLKGHLTTSGLYMGACPLRA